MPQAAIFEENRKGSRGGEKGRFRFAGGRGGEARAWPKRKAGNGSGEWEGSLEFMVLRRGAGGGGSNSSSSNNNNTLKV